MTERTIHFLLVEDNRHHSELVKLALQDTEIATTMDCVTDGAEALAYLYRDEPFADRPTPDVVLLDLKLPKVDGHEVLRRVKSDPVLRVIPIVVLTTSNADDDKTRAYTEHANSYMVKPLESGRLIEMIRGLNSYWAEVNVGPT